MTDREPDEGRAGLRSPAWIISAILIIAVLIVGGAAILWPRGDTPPEEPTTGPTADQTTASASPDASFCGLDAGDQTIPTEPPDDASWTLHGTFAAPSIQGVGPGVVETDGLAHCFAQSPTGAVLAAINYWGMGAVDPFFGLDERLVADTPEARQARQDQEDASGEAETDIPVYQLAGFEVANYADDVAQVNVVLRVSESAQLLLAPTPLRWEAGDWHYVYPPNGDPGFRAIDASYGFIEWAGV